MDIPIPLPFTTTSRKFPTPIKPAGSPPSDQANSAAKPKRAAYTDEEKEFLFTSYRENPYPSVSGRTEIADFLKKPFSQISCWFKNQRARSGDFKKGTPGKKLPKIEQAPITAIKMNLADEQEMPALELVKSEPTPDAVPPLLIEQTSAVQVPAANCISTSIHSPTQVVMTSRVQTGPADSPEPVIAEQPAQLPSPDNFSVYPPLGFHHQLNSEQQQYYLPSGLQTEPPREDPHKLLRLAMYNARAASALATEATTKALTANVILNALMKQMQSPFASLRVDLTSDGASGSSGSSSSGSAVDGPTDDGFEINVDRVSDSDSVLNLRSVH